MTEHYVGTKRVMAWPQEKNDAPGYAVKYEDGYISWSPKDVFESAYQAEREGMNFGGALHALKRGERVRRAGWNGKSMWLYLIKGSDLQSGLGYGFGEYLGEPAFVDSICMKTADNKLVVGWLASQTDMLAEDWQVLENSK